MPLIANGLLWCITTCVDSAVDSLTSDIHSMMDDCFPFKTVRMSSRDPAWITPLVKVLLKKRNKLQIKNPDSANEISKRIAQQIKENRKALTTHKTGSGMWWKNVDKLSNRKDRTNFNYEQSFIHNLNNYFGELCHDKEYIGPSPLHITDDMKNMLPQLTLSQVFYALSNIKRTATGPDLIPYWIWKDHAEVFAPVILEI